MRVLTTGLRGVNRSIGMGGPNQGIPAGKLTLVRGDSCLLHYVAKSLRDTHWASTATVYSMYSGEKAKVSDVVKQVIDECHRGERIVIVEDAQLAQGHPVADLPWSSAALAWTGLLKHVAATARETGSTVVICYDGQPPVAMLHQAWLILELRQAGDWMETEVLKSCIGSAHGKAVIRLR